METAGTTAPAKDPSRATPTGTPGPSAVAGDSFVDLREGVRFAMSWKELEGWIDRATNAFRRGELVADEVEELVELAIETSRQVPEQ